MPTPANTKIILEIQDNRGFRALTEFNGFSPDISTDTSVIGTMFGFIDAVRIAVAAASNAKVIRLGWGFDCEYAQEPSTEAGAYQLVTQKARLQGGDGNGGFMAASIPAPKDGLFLTMASEKLIVVDPASSLVTNLQGALDGAGIFPTPRGGQPFAQFFGGQLTEAKPRVRRVLQGS